MLGPFVLFHILGPDSHSSPQSILDRLLVRTLAKTVFRVILHVLLLVHACLLENHAITMCTVLHRNIFPLLFETDTSPSLLIMWNPHRLVSVIERVWFWIWKLLYLGCYPFPIIFDLNFGQEVTPIFIIQVTIVLLIIFQLFMHVWGEPILNSSLNIMNRELFVA